MIFAKESFILERFNTYDLRDKEVINLCDGARIGCPSDFEFSSTDGKITAIIVPGQGGFLGLGKSRDIIIPWNKIECIGEDTILVRLPPNEFFIPDEDRKKKKKGFWQL